MANLHQFISPYLDTIQTILFTVKALLSSLSLIRGMRVQIKEQNIKPTLYKVKN